MSHIVRYSNQVQGTRDRDGDHIAEGGNSSAAPTYEINLAKKTAVIGWGQLTLSMIRWQPVAFICGLLFLYYIVIPILVTAPVALFTNKPMVLTEKEAGGDLKAHTNNLTVGFRSFLGSAAEGVQANQIKTNSGNADKKPSESLIPKAKVVFLEQ